MILGPDADGDTTTFRDLLSDTAVLDGLTRLGFTTPTSVQRHAIPRAIAGSDLLVQAKTGSGKTLAFIAPMLVQLREAQSRGPVGHPFGLVIAPTRELALQIQHVVTSLLPEVQPPCLIGGVEMGPQLAALHRDPRIVIGTPGRIIDAMSQKALKLNQVKMFVLDEADEMLSMGFLPDIRRILSRLPDERQGLFVSATITPRVEMLANSFLVDAEQLIIDRSDRDLPPIEHLFCEVGGELMAKPLALCDLIETLRPSSAIIFCNTRSDTQLLESLLRRRGFDARRINSDLTQSQRNRIMRKIRDKELRFLIATDIAARGLDLEHIDLVINYAIHEQPEVYIHRTGRTGRAGKSGRAISLVGPRDFGFFHYLQKVVDVKFQKILLPSNEEVAEARFVHLQEILRRNRLELQERDLAVARLVFEQLGELREIPDELEQFLAKICRYAIEHHTAQEARSLDEELQSENLQRREGGERRERHGRTKRGRSPRAEEDQHEGRSRPGASPDEALVEDPTRMSDTEGERLGLKDDRRSGRRHGRRDMSLERSGGRRVTEWTGRGIRGEKYPERSQQPQHGERAESTGVASGFEQQGNREFHRRGRRQGPESLTHGKVAHSREDDGSHRASSGQSIVREEHRLYIGQGRLQGMTPEVFTGLAVEFADVPADRLQRLNIRERYGFVDVDEESAEKLIANLNGMRYNSAPLPVERATVFRDARRTPRPSRGDREERPRGECE